MIYLRCLILVLLSVGCSSRGMMGVPDSSADTGATADATADALFDGALEDAAVDAPSADATPDAGADATPDAATPDAATPDARADATPDAGADATPDAMLDAAPDGALDGAVGCGELGLPCTVNSECTMVGICSVEVGHCIPGRRPQCSDSTPCPDRYVCVRWHSDGSQGTCLEGDEIECSCGERGVAGHICPE